MSEKQNDFESDARKMIQKGRMVALVGSGVSRATTRRAPDWRELIKSGVERCCVLGESDAWRGIIEQQLAFESDPDMLLSAAELVHRKLRENGGGEFARWLRETFENLEPQGGTVIEALAALDIPLVTTNYDDLIEKVTGLKHVAWTDSRVAARVVRGEDRRILHVHGHWQDPDSVVLGIRSYESIRNHDHAQAVMKALGMTKSLLFVGCGAEGLSDPNFGNFLTWLEAVETDAGVEHRHYSLVCEEERFEPRGRLYPLVYGENYEDLPAFLESLRPDPPAAVSGTAAKKTPVRVLPQLPESVSYYLNCLTQETAHLTLMGMGRSLQVELPIDEAYVPLRTTMQRSMEERKTDRFLEGQADYEEDADLGEVFRKAAKLKQRGVILLGEPGAGKTTGARQLAWRLASRESLPEDLGLPSGVTPVLLRFRNLSQKALAKKTNGLQAFLEAETECDEAPDEVKSPGPDLWNGKAGPLLWILDGLDEVVDPAARSKVSGWIQKALRKRPDDWFLVTCRFQGYYREGVPLGPRFVEFHVRPLDDEQIDRFVRDWFNAAHAKLAGRGAEVLARAEADIDKLLGILARQEHTGHLRELCTNPLLLTILCIVFHEEKKLPTGRAELYAHCVRVLLEYWRRDLYDAEGGTGVEPYDAEAAQAVLARVAWWMHQEQDRTAAPLDELAEEAAKGLAEVASSSGLGLDGHAFVGRMRNEAGILAMAGDGEGRCGFLHLSFQEYLAAEHAAREGLAKELASVVTESWWREVALLSLRRSRPFCESFFREMLKVGIAENHPDLAQRCLEESLFFVPGPFVEALESVHDDRVAAILRLLRDRADQVPALEEISQRLAESKDAETRGFATEILVRRGVEPKVEAPEHGVHVDQRTGITFVSIQRGEFQMGSNEGHEWEKPVHRVCISQDFLLGKYPVTNAQYAEFLKAVGGSVEKPKYWDDRRFNQPEQPVVGVNWHDAQGFCEWAGCRLPTEAEWEYACRAGKTTAYSFGDDEAALSEYAWFDENSSGQSQPVGTKKPNPWGLHDMHGNVWEWCADWFSADYYAQSPEWDPQCPSKGGNRVGRGGSWVNDGRRCRSACRFADGPGYRIDDLGFRVCLARSPANSQPRAEPGA